MANSVRIPGNGKGPAANRVNEHVMSQDVVRLPKFSDLEVAVFGITAPIWAYKRFR